MKDKTAANTRLHLTPLRCARGAAEARAVGWASC